MGRLDRNQNHERYEQTPAIAPGALIVSIGFAAIAPARLKKHGNLFVNIPRR